MSEAIEALLKDHQLKSFVKAFKEQQKEHEQPIEFAAELAHYLCRRSYEPYYDDDLPFSYFGLAAAVNTLSDFPDDRKWWPIVQYTWTAANSRRRSPWPENGSDEPVTKGAREELFRSYAAGAEQGDFEGAWKAARVLLAKPEDRDWFRIQSLKRSLNDTFEEGVKFLYLDQCWRLAEALEWKDCQGILFPAIHLASLAPAETELSQSARSRAPGNHILAQKKKLDDDEYSALEEQFLSSTSVEEGLNVLKSLSEKAVGWEGTWDFLLQAASQMVGNTKPGRWSSAVRAFLYAYSARQLSKSLDEQALPAILSIATALVARTSQETREIDRNPELDRLANSFCPTDTFNTLRSLVSHSDPLASANAANTILGMDESKHAELFESLATLAAKNGGQQGRGYDLLLVQAAVDCYRNSTSSHRRKFLTNTAYVLGRMPKSYDLIGAYGV